MSRTPPSINCEGIIKIWKLFNFVPLLLDCPFKSEQRPSKVVGSDSAMSLLKLRPAHIAEYDSSSRRCITMSFSCNDRMSRQNRKFRSGIRSSVFRTNRSFFYSESVIRFWKRANRSLRSLVMSDMSELLTATLFKERRELFALGHRKGGNQWKNVKKHKKIYDFFEQFARFLRAINLNHERITGIALFQRNRERFSQGSSFVKVSLL